MGTTPDEFEAYLAPSEPVVAGTSGTLYADSFRSAGTVGVTDRRVLFVSEEGGFLDAVHGAVHSIRSHPQGRFAFRGMAPVLVSVLGAGVALAAAVWVLLLEPGVLGFVLLLGTVGGAALSDRIRRNGPGTDWWFPDDAWVAFLDRLSGVDRLREPVARARAGGDPDLVVLGVATVALLALVGLVAAAESLLVVPLSLAAIAGVALAEHGYRRRREADADREDRPRRRDVSIHLVDGRVIHLRIDDWERFDRELSVAVRESAPPTATAELSRS